MPRRPPLPAAILLAALAGACAPVVQNPAPPPAAADPPREYRIGIGDELDVRLFYTPDLNQSVTVRPDGKIALALVGDVHAEGKSAQELAAAVEAAYGRRVKRPQTVVNVRAFARQRVFVGGEVHRPGMVPLLGPLTVLQAVLAAQGMKETARADSVVLVRQQPEGERSIFTIDVEDVLSGRDLSQDVALQPSDMVFVPPSDIANLNRWIDMYIRRNLPFTANASYNFGPSDD